MDAVRYGIENFKPSNRDFFKIMERNEQEYNEKIYT
jgi:hypothetical protein